MISIETLKEIVRLMVDNELAEIDIRDAEETVTIKRGGQPSTPVLVAAPAHHAPALAAASTPSAPAPPASPTPTPASDLPAIESPMVGTFYSAADPDSPPFVSVGKSVGPDDVVCLIEAMKVFNEIKAERAGVIEKVLVSSGQPVEFGQKLFLVRPA
jgi:acetyl-CoA carboxylase biotin carboxyl carrier protein